MPKLSLKALQKRIASLQQRAEKLKQREKGPAVREIVGLMHRHEVSLDELGAALGGKKGRGPGRKGKRGKVPAMYRNPKTGETWSGRGRAARWIAAAEKAGRKRTEFLIKKA